MTSTSKACRRLAVAGSLVLGCIVLGPGRASADTSISTSVVLSGAFSTTSSGDALHSLTFMGEFQRTVVNGQPGEIFACEAVASPDAASTGIASCTLDKTPADPTADPGPLAATTGTASYPLSTTLKLCGQANATFVDGSVTTTVSCTSTPILPSPVP